MTQDNNKKIYKLVLDDDNTLKTFFDRFYVVPKQENYTKEQLEFLKDNAILPLNELVKSGRNGYLCFRGKKSKKVNEQIQQEILNSDLPYRELSKIYKISTGTICKIKKGIY